MECWEIGQPVPRRRPIRRVVNDHNRTLRRKNHVHINLSQVCVGDHAGLEIGRLHLSGTDCEGWRIPHLPQRVDDLAEERLGRNENDSVAAET